MARIAGVDLPRRKHIVYALPYLFGIGHDAREADLQEGRASPRTSKVDELTDAEVKTIRDVLDADYKVEGDLRREVQLNIKRLMDLGCYRGLRHRRGLPVNGQRTHTNARTRKGPRKGMLQRRPAAAAPKLLESTRSDRRRIMATAKTGDQQGQAEEEGQEEHRGRHRAHPVDVQQHRRHDHRHQRQRRRVVERRLARLQGLAQVDAVRGAARGRRSGAPRDGARDALGRRVREGSRRRPRERAPRPPDRGLQGHADPRRHADPAQRLPAAQAAPGLTENEIMARYLGPVCKLCRREGTKLYLKGERCYSEKCAYTRRPYPPGQHGQGRIKLSEYAVRLREKQKVRRIYGVLERQFRGVLPRGDPPQGPHRRGDARPPRAPPRQRRAPPGLRRHRAPQARQLVRHGHVLVNGKRLDIPSYVVRAGDKIEIRREEPRSSSTSRPSLARRRQAPDRLVARGRQANFAGTFKGLPVREELNEPAIREQLRRRVLLALISSFGVHEQASSTRAGWRAPLESGFDGRARDRRANRTNRGEDSMSMQHLSIR